MKSFDQLNPQQHLGQHVPLQEYLLLYGDSRGVWDGLAYNGVSVNFFPFNETDYDRAISKLRERLVHNDFRACRCAQATAMLPAFPSGSSQL